MISEILYFMYLLSFILENDDEDKDIKYMGINV